MAGFSGMSGVPEREMEEAIEQSTAWSNNWLTDTSILAYAANVANPSFTTFRTNATSTDVPIANEYYIGTVERYGQNITVKMTTMQDASKMYINNSVNSGSTWTGWKTFLDSQSTTDVIDDIATRLNITSTDDTWSEIYSKLSLLPNRGTATLYIMNTTAASLLTGGKIANVMAGMVVQSNTGVYEFMMKHINSSSIYIWRIEGLTSADATPTIRTVYRFDGTAM